MKTIISKDDFKIIQTDPYTYTIQFYSYSEYLIKSLTKTNILLGSTTTDNFHELKFKATSVKTFKQYQEYHKNTYGTQNINYNSVLIMIYNLSTQLKYLEQYSRTFIGYSPENIIVINENKFIYLSNEHLQKINITQEVMITSPFSQNDFFITPELNKITELPSYIHYKSVYFSFGKFILYSLTSEDNLYNKEKYNDIYTDSEHEDKYKYKHLLELTNDLLDSIPIKETPLYWLIKRCLVEDPKKRSIIFI